MRKVASNLPSYTLYPTIALVLDTTIWGQGASQCPPSDKTRFAVISLSSRTLTLVLSNL